MKGYRAHTVIIDELHQYPNDLQFVTFYPKSKVIIDGKEYIGGVDLASHEDFTNRRWVRANPLQAASNASHTVSNEED